MNNKDDSKEGIKKYLLRNPDTCFVVEKEYEIIGAIMSGHDGRRGFIYHTAVKASEREQGIGSALLESAVTALKNEGINKVALVVLKKTLLGICFGKRENLLLEMT